ncbi:MAG: hypothetical protein O3C10_13260 [Chloroflexi bacterium]|nr:hypothetical protein [Chloroflexota bacterium]
MSITSVVMTAASSRLTAPVARRIVARRRNYIHTPVQIGEFR